mgnify:CR=1 FL=1
MVQDAYKVNRLLKETNKKLKSGGVGLTVEKRGTKLSLRGKFPPQPGENDDKNRRLSLDIYANPAGIKRAESEAKRIAGA